MTWIDKGCYKRGCACHDDRLGGETVEVVLFGSLPVYDTPLQRTWIGLAEEDKHKPDMGAYVYLNDDWLDGYKTGMEYAEAILKEKNK